MQIETTNNKTIAAAAAAEPVEQRIVSQCHRFA